MPYTIDPNPSGVWHAPDLAKAERLITASHTRGTPITIWDLGIFQGDLIPAYGYLVSLLDRLGYPTRVINFENNIAAGSRWPDSRAKVQAAVYNISPNYLSASQILQYFGCRYFIPDSASNGNPDEFCDHQLDSQIDNALAAERSNSPDASALWAQADRTVTDQAPVIPMTTETETDFVSHRVGDYQYSFQQGALLDRLWVR